MANYQPTHSSKPQWSRVVGTTKWWYRNGDVKDKTLVENASASQAFYRDGKVYAASEAIITKIDQGLMIRG